VSTTESSEEMDSSTSDRDSIRHNRTSICNGGLLPVSSEKRLSLTDESDAHFDVIPFH
jgi:hypothetical protein